MRRGPFEECDSPDGNKTAKGTRFTVVGELINGRGHLWYVTSDGRYIYGEWADYAGEDSAVRFGEVTGSVRSGYEFLGWFADDMTAFAVQPEWVVSAWQNFTLTARRARLEEEAPEKVNTIQLWIDLPFLSVNGEVRPSTAKERSP